ncbi:MAG: hypothetical protein ACK4RK_09185 [Gemmataceae bacterium]
MRRLDYGLLAGSLVLIVGCGQTAPPAAASLEVAHSPRRGHAGRLHDIYGLLTVIMIRVVLLDKIIDNIHG